MSQTAHEPKRNLQTLAKKNIFFEVNFKSLNPGRKKKYYVDQTPQSADGTKRPTDRIPMVYAFFLSFGDER
jgi:hypothetical protein